MGFRYETETVEQQRCVGAECDKCGKELEQAFGFGETFYGALVVRAEGGYGMLVDNMFEGDAHIILCEECGTAFMKEWFPHWNLAN